MAEEINPYQPPASFEVPESWWKKILNYLFVHHLSDREIFESGEPLFVEGIAFLMDPKNEEFIYALTPSTDHSDDRMTFIAREVKRLIEETCFHTNFSCVSRKTENSLLE